MPLNIRARLNLEIGKFRANAKAAGASFKLIASSAKISTDKIDAYLKASNDKRIAQIRRTEAMEIQSARQRAKILSKIEQEKYRNQGGIRPGTNAGRNLGLQEKQVAAMAKMSAKQRAQYERNLATQFKAIQKEKLAAAKARLKRQQELERAWAKNDRATLRDISRAYKQAEKEKQQAANARAKRERELTRAYSGWERNERKRLNAWLKQNYNEGASAHKRMLQKMKQDALKNKIDYFNSEEFNSRLAAMRYALYDVSRRATMFGAAIAGAFAAAVKSAIDFESAFTAVERTTQLTLNSNIPEVRGQAQDLRDTLIQMTTEIPVAFADITEIATLGAQMGIAANDVDEFTGTVARFSAITKIGVEDVALSFGRISQLLGVSSQEFEKLSSAIAFTGVNSVSTDKEILRMSEAIGAAATNAGLAAADTIGFAAALASLKVRPEEARGVLTRLFREFDLSVSAAGPKLDDLASLIGKTSEQAAALWKQDPSQFVQSFLKSAKATGELNQVITALGITNSRELNVITRLANNMGVLESAISDSREQFELGTFSTEAYGLVVDDLSSKITMLQNSIAAMGAAFGEELVPFLSIAVDAIRTLIDNLAAAPDWMQGVVLGVTALVGGLALLVGGGAATVAGLFALKLIMTEMGLRATGAAAGVGTFRAMIISLIPGATGATGVLNALGLAAQNAGRGFMAASIGVKAFTAALGVIGIAAAVIGTIAAFAGGAANAKKEVEELAKANFEAAGGLEAFKKASEDGLEGGAKVYREVTDSVSKLTDEQKAETKATLEAAVAKAKLSTATEDGRQKLADAEAALRKFNNEVERGTGLTEESTLALTENTKEVLANALQKISLGGDESLNIFEEIATITPEVEGVLQQSGLDAVDILDKSMEAAMTGDMSAFQYMQEQFANVSPDLRNTAGWNDFVKAMLEAAKATDSNIDSAIKANASYEILGQVIGDAGQDAEDTTDDFIDLNEILKATVTSLTAIQQAEGSVASALDTFAQGAAETAGEMDGLGEAARTNLSNFASFMQSAVDASIAAGTGTRGAVETIIGGLNALSAAGIDTGDAFGLAKPIIMDYLESIIPGVGQMFALLGAPQSMQGVEDAIRALYAAKIAAADTPNDVRRLREELEATLAMIAGFGSKFSINMGKAKESTERTLTALEKLQAQLTKLFSVTNTRIAVQESINSLGDSIRENGNVFSAWSEDGRANISSLLGAIDELAVLSKGNLQTFANELGALRAALVRVGAPATALRYIDAALRETGKTAKVSAKEVDRFYDELSDSNAAERSLAEIASAVSSVQSALKASISAYFAQGDAIDDITLGWLDMADAADSAREAIANAQETIDDARRSIDEANASIQGLAAQKNSLEYQLQIAIKYGDELRADEIRAEIAQLNSDIANEQDNIADANKAIADAQKDMAEAQGELGFNSSTRQIIEQNRALRDMALRYADATAWMLATAEEGADLNAIIESQVEDFYNNAVQMGYSETEARALADVLRTELIASMDDIPKDITTEISAETDAALNAVTKFARDANARLDTIKSKTITVTTRYVEVGRGGGGGGSYAAFSSGGLVRGPGSATSDSIAARLSNGEYVVKAAAVSRYGVDFFNAINQMQVPRGSLLPSAPAAGMSQTVYLSPEDRQLLRQAIDRPVALYTDNTVIAKSANEGNAILAQRGIR